MESSKKHVTTAQVNALMDFMQNVFEKDDLDARWKDFAESLNSMGGAVKSVDRWKQTWRDLKSNTKKRALKHHDSAGLSSDCGADTSLNMDSDNQCTPKKKCCSSFDDEIIKIERDKLEFEREYKIQKIEVLARIASALEELAKKQ